MGQESLTGLLPLLVLVTGVLAAVALVVAIAAAAATRRLRVRPRAAGQLPADRGERARQEFASVLRRYSEQLGVELVTGRISHRDGGSTALRVQLEETLAHLREPGAVELVDEVGDAREHLAGWEPRRRAAANGIVAMEVEWSIDRWVADPRAWLADVRERERLRRIAQSDQAEELRAAS